MKSLLTIVIIAASLTLSAVAQPPQSNYQKVRNMNVLADKKRFVLGLERAEQVRVWRSHFAYVFITEDLTAEQQEYLLRSLRAFESGNLTDDLDQEAKELFDFELGRRVFNLGPWTETGTLCSSKTVNRRSTQINANKLLFAYSYSRPSAFIGGKTLVPRVADCNCGQTSTNWGCSGSCDPSNSCTPTPDGCSIFYMYPCNGKCSTEEIE